MTTEQAIMAIIMIATSITAGVAFLGMLYNNRPFISKKGLRDQLNKMNIIILLLSFCTSIQAQDTIIHCGNGDLFVSYYDEIVFIKLC